MPPFQPPFRSQNQVRGGNDPSFNQFPWSSSTLPNQLGFNNPQILVPTMEGLHNQNALTGGLLVQRHPIQQLQNNFIVSLPQQEVIPQLHGHQLNLLGGLQNPHLLSLQLDGLLSRPSLSQNLNQMMGFSPNGFICSQNPIFAPISLSPVMILIYGNPNPVVSGNGNPQIAQSTSNFTGFETQIANQKLQKTMSPSPVQNNQSSGQQLPQMTPSRVDGKNISSNSSENVSSSHFKTNFDESRKREPSHIRFQKSNSSRNSWKKEKSFPRVDREGKQQRNNRNTELSENNDNTSIKSSRAVIYNESEVQRWREARKKNFPTRAKVEKMLITSSSKDHMDSDAMTHLQELKEVLAIQAELGIRGIPVNMSANKKGRRFRYLLARRLRFKKNAPKLANLQEERTNPSEPEKEPEKQPSMNTVVNEASNTYSQTRQNCSNNKRRMSRRDKKNAKKLKVKKETPLIVNHQEDGTNPSVETSGC